MSKRSQQNEQVMIQAEERIPMGTEGVSISYFPITDNDIGKNIQVELVAARADFIRSYVELVHDAGYTVVAVDVDSLANLNAFKYNYEVSSESVICLMDVGNYITNLVFVIQGNFFSMRDISIGMNSIWQSIQNELGISHDDINHIKDGHIDLVGADQLREAVLAAIGDLKVSLDTAFTYLETITEGQMVNKVYLTGGGALVPYFKDSINQKMGIQAELLNPFKNFSFEPDVFTDRSQEEIGALFSVATGLAIRAD
jgi:type IV pilus assembly protein PilM